MGEQKKREQAKRREKSKQLARLRTVQLAARKALLDAETELAATESEVNKLDDSITH